jgi:hypothetical protein
LNEHGKEVVFVSQVPEVGWAVPSVLARSRLFGRTVPPAPSIEAYRKRQRSVDAVLKDLATRYRFRIADSSPTFCAHSVCQVVKDGHPLYRDEHHLSVAGSLLAVDGLRGLF